MDPPTDPQAYSLPINTFCELPQASLEGFCCLVQEFLPLAQIAYLEHLGGIFLVGDGQMAEMVNSVARQGDQTGHIYTPNVHPATATAVPVEQDDLLKCFVLLEDSLVRPLTPTEYLVYPTTSVLLEELLHVRVYSGLWKHLRSGVSSSAIDRGESPFVLCMNALGEYLANRWKANLFSTLPLTAVEGGYAAVSLQYPDALGLLLDDAGQRIIAIVTAVARGAKPYDVGWQELLQVVYRGILEPLARECAYVDGSALEKGPRREPSAEQSSFYRQHVASYWDDWRRALRRAADTFDTDPAQVAAALVTMRESLVRFLSHVGVEYEPREGGQSHVMFYGWTALALKRAVADSE